MNEMKYEEFLPKLLSGDELINALKSIPSYDESIRAAEMIDRLDGLSDVYKTYYPFPLAVEVYNRLYLATKLSLKKKNTRIGVEQRNLTYKAMMGDRQYHGIIGGADSLTIVGRSGIGKTAAVQRAIELISGGQILEINEPFVKIIPCLQVQCPYDASPKGLLLEILRNVDNAIGSRYYECSRKASDTVDVLIGSVALVAQNHIGLLVIDEIQNVYGRKSGTSLMSMIIQLINSSGISIAMVGTEECVPFFEKTAQFARRAQGLRCSPLAYDHCFEDFCRRIWEYQYTSSYSKIDAGILEWLFEHSGGVVSNVITLIHDAQEIAILEGIEELSLISLNMAFKNRMSFLHGYIDVSTKPNPGSLNRKRSVLEVSEDEESLSIDEMVMTAKNKSVDILSYLKEHIQIEEVACE